MRRSLLLIACILLCLGFQTSRTNFTGKWELDFKKSKGLPPSTFKGVEQYVMEIQESHDSMTVYVELKGSGQDVKYPSSVYTFSGKEILREDTPRGSKRWSKTKWIERGKKFVVTSRIEQTVMQRSQRYRQTDSWEIRSDGILEITIKQKFEPRDSTSVQHRYFHRMK